MYKDHTGPQLLGVVGNITKCNGLVHGSVGFLGNTKVLKGWAGCCCHGCLQWHWNAVSSGSGSGGSQRENLMPLVMLEHEGDYTAQDYVQELI